MPLQVKLPGQVASEGPAYIPLPVGIVEGKV